MKKMIPVSEPNISKKEIQYVTDAVKSGWISSIGHYVNKFEADFAKYCDRKFGVAVSNGTVALHLALLALGIKEGDEVIVPNITFIATSNAVTYVGAKTVLVDIDSKTWNMDPQKIREKITKNTKAIIVVHLYGNPCDMTEISKIAKEHNLKIVEDAAEAHGSLYKGKKCGSFGDISTFSFYGNKTITTGEGGMCLTNDKKLNEKLRLLRGQGMSSKKRYWHDVVGYNYRITNLQSALGCAQLERIDDMVNRKKNNAKLYKQNLSTVPWIIFQEETPNSESSHWMFSVLIDPRSKYKRESVLKKLAEKGIETRIIFYPLSDMPPYKSDEKFDVSKTVSYSGFSLPSSTKLKKEDIIYICNEIKKL